MRLKGSFLEHENKRRPSIETLIRGYLDEGIALGRMEFGKNHAVCVMRLKGSFLEHENKRRPSIETLIRGYLIPIPRHLLLEGYIVSLVKEFQSNAKECVKAF
jgi:hypothetical protein